MRIFAHIQNKPDSGFDSLYIWLPLLFRTVHVIVAGVESFPLHYGTKRYSIRSRSGSNARLHECS
jgi:hypothetical protein